MNRNFVKFFAFRENPKNISVSTLITRLQILRIMVQYIDCRIMKGDLQSMRLFNKGEQYSKC